MGVRLYFRNKDRPENEYCLGKFLGYADPSDQHTSIDFLVEVGALDGYEWDTSYRDIPDRSEMAASFIEECHYCRFYEYGGMFELCTEDLVWFIRLYWDDHAKLFDHESWDVREELQFIQQNASIESRWEFRLF